MKLKGWLIVNEFLHGKKFSELNEWLVNAAVKRQIQLDIYTNAQLMPLYDENGVRLLGVPDAFPDFVIFWDKDVDLAKAMEALHIPVFNSADAILDCDDKGATCRVLAGAGLPMPLTIKAPMTFPAIGYNSLDFLKRVEAVLSYPFVIKECFGSFGAQVYLVHDTKEADVLLKQLAGKPLLFQEFIKSSEGRDTRINMVGAQAVTAMLRSNDRDFRANITNGGSMQPYTPTAEQIALAKKACEVLGLDFAGVDLLFGEDGEPLICEVNSNAHFKNIYDCTGVNVADYILDYILERIGETNGI